MWVVCGGTDRTEGSESTVDRAEVESLLGDMRRLGRDTLRVEAKRARGGMPTTLHKTFSAFANGDGGVVLLGVDEQTAFSVTGIDEPGPMLDRVVTLCRSMDPRSVPRSTPSRWRAPRSSSSRSPPSLATSGPATSRARRRGTAPSFGWQMGISSSPLTRFSLRTHPSQWSPRLERGQSSKVASAARLSVRPLVRSDALRQWVTIRGGRVLKPIDRSGSRPPGSQRRRAG